MILPDIIPATRLMLAWGDLMTIRESTAALRTSIRLKLCLVYLMNVADWICTVVLTRTGDYTEANPLMATVIGELSWSFVLKCAVPLAAVWLIDRLCAALVSPALRSADRWVSFAVVFYTAILTDHTVNLLIWYCAHSQNITGLS